MVSVELPSSLKTSLDAPPDAGASSSARSRSISEPVSGGSSLAGCPGCAAETEEPDASYHGVPSAAPSSASSSSSHSEEEESPDDNGKEVEHGDTCTRANVQVNLFDMDFDMNSDTSSLASNAMAQSRIYLRRYGGLTKMEDLQDFLKILFVLSPQRIDKPLSALRLILTDTEHESEEWLDFHDGFLAPLPHEFVVFIFWFPRRWPQRFRLSQDHVLRRLRETLANKRILDPESLSLNSLPYEHGDWSIDAECAVCFGHYGGLTRLCCGRVVCEGCRQRYFITAIEEGRTSIFCPVCPKACSRLEVNAHLPPEAKEKFSRFLVEANKDPNRKTCPNCCHITERPTHTLTKKELKFGLNLTCESCGIEWCFNCQAPKHGMSCKKFSAGDVLLRQWAKREFLPGGDPVLGNRNARRCPGCKVFIHRYDGCPEMRCTQCGKVFCFACGQPMRHLFVIGNHSSRLSVLGCKKRLFPNNAPLRWLIRGSLFVGCGLGVAVVSVPVGLVLGVGLMCRMAHKAVKRRRHRPRWLGKPTSQYLSAPASPPGSFLELSVDNILELSPDIIVEVSPDSILELPAMLEQPANP